MTKEQTRKYNSFYQIITTVNTTPEQKYELLEILADAIIKEEISQEKEKWREEINKLNLPPISYRIEEISTIDGNYASQYVDIEDVKGYKQRIINLLQNKKEYVF